ncbi:MAG TPA: hypothetical protein VJZ49_10630 [Syntrophales bacterium]|nr:hypothetical protein [Syntrophales bacterium]
MFPWVKETVSGDPAAAKSRRWRECPAHQRVPQNAGSTNVKDGRYKVSGKDSE